MNYNEFTKYKTSNFEQYSIQMNQNNISIGQSICWQEIS